MINLKLIQYDHNINPQRTAAIMSTVGNQEIIFCTYVLDGSDIITKKDSIVNAVLYGRAYCIRTIDRLDSNKTTYNGTKVVPFNDVTNSETGEQCSVPYMNITGVVVSSELLHKPRCELQFFRINVETLYLSIIIEAESEFTISPGDVIEATVMVSAKIERYRNHKSRQIIHTVTKL